MAVPLLPDDDLYARLEVTVEASPEAVELAWRALLKRHHPDVAGDGAAALDLAKRINVAHDWLADPALRARYDRDRLGRGSRGSARRRDASREPRSPRPPVAHRPTSPRAGSRRPDIRRGDPVRRLARFLERVERLSPDELDRLAAAEPPPIAFLATIRRFLPPAALAAFAETEASLEARIAPGRWASAGLREGLLGVAAEVVLAPFLDEMLAEPFRGRARDRMLRAWEAAVDQPRYGPNAAEVVALRARVGALTAPEVAAFNRASAGIPGDDRPWPASLRRDDDEALRVSALLAADDAAATLRLDGLAQGAQARARRLLGRLGHVVALRHAFPPATYALLSEPFVRATGGVSARPTPPGPDVRRAG